MPELRRDDLPEALRPLFDQLTFEIHRVQHAHDQLRRVRFWQLVSLGMLVSATIINVVPPILRAL